MFRIFETRADGSPTALSDAYDLEEMQHMFHMMGPLQPYEYLIYDGSN